MSTCFYTIVSKFVLVFSLIIFIGACNIMTPVDIDTSTDESIVLYGLFSPDDSIGIYIYHVTSVEFAGFSKINHSKVELYCNDDWVCSLVGNDSGYYYSNVIPKYGCEYKIVVDNEKYGHVEATSSLPRKVLVDSINFIKNGGVSPWGDNFSQITISFSDYQDESNYYEVLPYSIVKSKRYNNEIFFTYSMNDPVLLNSGCIDNAPNFAYFTDDMIDGECYSMNLHIMDNLNMDKDGYQLFIRFMAVNYDMYQYHKKMVEHIANQGSVTDFLITLVGNPVSMYSNVEGGYGVFAGYCKQDIEIIGN